MSGGRKGLLWTAWWTTVFSEGVDIWADIWGMEWASQWTVGGRGYCRQKNSKCSGPERIRVWHSHGMERRLMWLKLDEWGVEGKIWGWKSEQEPNLAALCGHGRVSAKGGTYSNLQSEVHPGSWEEDGEGSWKTSKGVFVSVHVWKIVGLVTWARVEVNCKEVRRAEMAWGGSKCEGLITGNEQNKWHQIKNACKIPNSPRWSWHLTHIPLFSPHLYITVRTHRNIGGSLTKPVMSLISSGFCCC